MQPCTYRSGLIYALVCEEEIISVIAYTQVTGAIATGDFKTVVRRREAGRSCCNVVSDLLGKRENQIWQYRRWLLFFSCCWATLLASIRKRVSKLFCLIDFCCNFLSLDSLIKWCIVKQATADGRVLSRLQRSLPHCLSILSRSIPLYAFTSGFEGAQNLVAAWSRKLRSLPASFRALGCLSRNLICFVGWWNSNVTRISF